MDQIRNDMAARLPGLIEAAFRRYEQIAGEEPGDSAKAVADHARACRAAVQHLEQLLKLAQWAGGENAVAQPPDDIDRLIADAEAALQKSAAES